MIADTTLKHAGIKEEHEPLKHIEQLLCLRGRESDIRAEQEQEQEATTDCWPKTCLETIGDYDRSEAASTFTNGICCPCMDIHLSDDGFASHSDDLLDAGEPKT